MSKKIAIIGAGDLGQHMAHYLLKSQDYQVVGFYDDFKSQEEKIMSLPILGKLSDFELDYKNGIFSELFLGIGYKHLSFRYEIYKRIFGKIPLAKYVHRSCLIDTSAQIKAGSFLLPGSIIDKGAIIEENTFVNVGCVIAHDTKIGANCFLAPGVKMAGFIKTGHSCFFGIGTTVINNLNITDNVQTAAGSVLVNNIDESGIYIGVPAKKK
jgi:sugar O-acyltransferase (sialic acid O-acetyltransferase NeuD family)